jgi:signal transduction histidine kinase
MDDSRFAVLFENFPQPACIIDSAGHITAWNPALQNVTGQATENVMGLPLRGAGKLAETLYIHWASIADKRSRLTQKIQGANRIFYATYIPIPDSDWLLILDLESAVDEQKKDSLYVVAHDLQNPLTGIKGFAELITNVGEVNERQSLYVKRIMGAVDEMTEMLGNLLDVAWVDSGMQPKIAPTNLAHLVHSIGSSYQEQARSKGIILQMDIDRIPNVLCDERRMKQVINNLISNALKYSPNGGDVLVRLRQDGNVVFFEISDQGMGIPPEHQQKIFERFYRVPSDNDIEGNGLGLAISYEILQKHGEKLHVESAENKGSRFYFKLPIAY